MIVSFSCSNFRSIKDEVTLSFEPTNEEVKKTSQTYEVVPDVHLLRMAIIHGANASGKTNVLRALNFLSTFWGKNTLNKNEGIDILPFKFQEDDSKNSTFELIAYINDTKMVYKLELNSEEVVRESLDYYGSAQPSNAFTRTTKDGVSEIQFPAKMKVSAAAKEVLTLRCLPNSTVISAYAQINAKIAILDEFEKWIHTNTLPVIYGDSRLGNIAKQTIQENPEVKAFVLEFLKEADFNVVDLKTALNNDDTSKTIANLQKKLLDVAFKELPFNEKDKATQYELVENAITNKYKLDLIHKVVDDDDNATLYSLNEELQSEGTNRLLELAVLLKGLLQSQQTAGIDELERSLHPYLLYYFIRRFLEEENNPSQLIVTSHYDGLLNQTSWIDKDLFWFTEKKKDGSTDLYSLSDFKGLNRMSIQKAYLSGNFGALPEIDY